MQQLREDRAEDSEFVLELRYAVRHSDLRQAQPISRSVEDDRGRTAGRQQLTEAGLPIGAIPSVQETKTKCCENGWGTEGGRNP